MRNGREGYGRRFNVGLSPPGMDHSNAGVNVMGAIGEKAEHAFRLGDVSGLVEDGTIQDNGGIGSKRHSAGVLARDGCSLLQREAADVGNRVFAGVAALIDVGRMDGVPNGNLGQEFAAARGGGGEDQHAPRLGHGFNSHTGSGDRATVTQGLYGLDGQVHLHGVGLLRLQCDRVFGDVGGFDAGEVQPVVGGKVGELGGQLCGWIPDDRGV